MSVEQREAEQDAGERQIEEGGEDEDAERRDRRDDELRQVLAEIGLQLLDPVDQGEQCIARALRAELAGAEGCDLVEEPRADLQLHQGGGVVRRHGAPVFEHAARQHRHRHGHDRQDQVVEAVALEDPPQQPAEQREPRDPTAAESRPSTTAPAMRSRKPSVNCHNLRSKYIAPPVDSDHRPRAHRPQRARLSNPAAMPGL